MTTLTAEQKTEFLDSLRELATESGVDGVPRLVALFFRDGTETWACRTDS